MPNTYSLKELMVAATSTKSRFDGQFTDMTLEHAQFVRRLRIDDGYSWRAVASACADAWAGDWNGNQLAGMAICERAAELCGEDYDADPWN
jgi:hypothetical protein